MIGPADQHAPDIQDYIRVVRARKWEILLVTALVVGLTVFLSFQQTPIYQSQAKVLVRPIQTATSSTSVPQAPDLATEREVALSRLVTEQVRRNLSLATPADQLLKALTVQVVTDTQVLLIKFADPDPRRAAALTNGFANAYVKFRAEQARSQFQVAAAALQRRVDDLQSELSDITRKINSTTNSVLKDSYQTQRDGLIAQLGVLNQRLLDLQANSSISQSDPAQILESAEIPGSPASPNKTRNAILALVAGLALGVGFAFLRERLDDRLKSRHELERRVGAPVLAAVPRVSAWKKPEEVHLVMQSDPKSPVSEAYRTLGTNIQYLATQRPLKVLMVTSAIGGDGKTTTSANLAMALALAGKRTFLVSADLRKPRVHRFFRVSNEAGLAEAISEGAPITALAVDPGVPNLRLINAGRIPSDPASLLGSKKAAEFMESLREVSDYVIIDTPPVLAVADASIMAPLVDGTIFVVDAERSSRSTLIQARDQLENAGAEIIGAVYGNFDPSALSRYPYYYYNYYYYQYYGQDGNGSKPRDSKSRRRRKKAEARAATADRAGVVSESSRS